jgi:hypothetical protein
MKSSFPPLRVRPDLNDPRSTRGLAPVAPKVLLNDRRSTR